MYEFGKYGGVGDVFPHFVLGIADLFLKNHHGKGLVTVCGLIVLAATLANLPDMVPATSNQPVHQIAGPTKFSISITTTYLEH